MKKNTKTILSVLAAGAFSCALLCQQAQAIPITGSIDMSGTATLDSVSLATAKKATSLTAVTVGGTPTGAYAGTAGTPVTWSSFGWAAAPLPPITPLWSFAFNPGGGVRTYTFDLLTVSVASQSSTFLNLLGTGTLKITGVGPIYDDTTGSWSFTISNPPPGGDHANFAFTFANSQTSVPDGGVTLALLGFALVGVEGLRRKLTA